MKVYSSRQTSRTMCVLILVAVIAALSLVGPVASASDPEARYLIGFRHADKAQKADLLRSANATVHRSFHLVPAVAAKMSPTAAARLAANPNVAYVEPDLQVRALAQSVPWGITRIGAPTVHNTGNTGTSIKVAIIDTGIDYTHPDLAANFKGGYDFVNDDSDPMDDKGHGTHCAGTVAAVHNSEGVLGVAPQVWLYGVKMLDASGEGTLSDAVAAIEWCVDNGIQVASMSWGAENNPISETLQDACAAAYAGGVVLVAAAGNSGPGTNTVNQPGILDSVIAVAATDETDSWAWFSSTGPAVEVAAPGVGVVSTVPGGGYSSSDGTSMACPHVSGVAALIIASGVTGAPQVRERLRQTAQDLGAPGRDEYFGYGLVRADWAAGGYDVIVTGITPNLGANDGPIGVSVSGLGFESGAATQLAKSGQAPIVGTGVTVVSGTQITCQFDLTGADGGAWDVVVTNPGADPAALPRGFYALGDVDEDFETGDFSRWPWVTSGDADWTVSNADSHTGAYSARAGSMPMGGSSSLEVTLTCGAGDIGFFKQLSCVAGVLIFYVDGDYVGEWSGVSAWDSLPTEYTVLAGVHTFKWEYWDLIGDPQGTVWLDDISFPPLAGEHALNIIAGPSGTPNPVGSEGGVTCSVSAQDTLGHALTYAWTATGGAFDDATSAAPTWTAPANTGDTVAEYTIEVTVSCAEDATLNDTGSYVQQVNPEGTATVTGITPDTGVNAGPVDVTISGSDFETGATTQLTRSGHSPIAGTGVTVVSDTQITCQFNLLGAAEGDWDVDVTNPGADPATLAGGFQVVGDVDEDFETGDFSRWPWTTSGDADWVVTNTDSHNGTYSASAGGMSTDGSSYLQVTLTCGAGDISFHKKLSCLGGFLIFYVDGSPIGEWNGVIDWGATPDETTVSAGTHTFKWEYWDLVGDPLGFVWIDDISFPPVSGSHTVTITAGPTGTPNPVDSEGEVVCSVAAQDSFGHALTYAWTATGGSFDDVASPAPTWTAPANTSDEIAEYTIGVTVRCAEDPSVRAADSYVQQVTVANTPPTQPTVDVTPDNPATGDDLQVAASGSTDADGDTVNYTYKWYKDDVHQATYDDLTTVPSSATSRVEVWQCVVTPNDGTDDGPAGEDQVTIGNTAPTQPTVTITPPDPGTDDSFRCVGSGSTDADGDSVSYSYQWYKNGALQPGVTWQRIGASRTRPGQTWKCVVTPNDGSDNGPTGEDQVTVGNTAPTQPTVTITPPDPGTDDSFRCVGSGSTDADGDSVSYSYQWYKNGTLQPGVTWQRIGASRTRRGQTWKCVVTPNDGSNDGPTGEASVTIGNSTPTAPTVAITPGDPTTSDSFRATASGSTDADGDSVSYSYQWYKNGVLQAGVTWQRIGASRTRAGQTWRCVVTPNDGTTDGPTGEDQVTIGNTAPTQPAVAITPADPTSENSLRAGASGSTDLDSDPITYSYQWYKNGTLQAGRIYRTLGARWTSRGQTWKCVVTPNDGSDDGPTGEDRVTVGNSTPTAPTVAITPGDPTTSDSFRATAWGSTDADGDSVSYSYQWYKNGVLQAGVTWQRIGASRTRLGQTWRCVVTPNDGFDDGPTGEASVVIGDKDLPGPVVVSSLTVLPTAIGAEMTFALSAHASVTCEVLNIAGRAVKTIVSDRPMEAGIKSLTWDGRNAAGLRAPSGMYLVRMTATGTTGARWTSMGTLNLTR